MNTQTYVIDTNVLLNNPQILNDKKCIILDVVLREIERLERKKDLNILQYQIREAKRTLNKMLDLGLLDIRSTSSLSHSVLYADDTILEYMTTSGSNNNELVLITDDILLKFRAIAHEINVISAFVDTKPDTKDYKGVYQFFYNPDDENDRDTLSTISTMSGTDYYHNPFDMYVNQYLVVWDQSTKEISEDGKDQYKEAGTYRFDGVNLKRLNFKTINNSFEKLKPINIRQMCAFDLMQNKNIPVKLVTGEQGVGKDAVMLGHAIDFVNQGYFDKIIWIRNNIEVKDTNSIGYLPDSLEDKLAPFIGPLVDKLGGPEGYARFKDRIEISHLGFLRGREFKNSIIYVTECQSNTRDHIKLLLGRVGEDSEIWFNGDTKQNDHKKFEHDNGVVALKELAGNELFGHVDLDKVERSDTANLAALLD